MTSIQILNSLIASGIYESVMECNQCNQCQVEWLKNSSITQDKSTSWRKEEFKTRHLTIHLEQAYNHGEM